MLYHFWYDSIAHLFLSPYYKSKIGFYRVRSMPNVESFQSENKYFTEMCSGSEAGSYLRFIDLCITQL